ncbi:MAG: hypothetical protein IPM64_15010 [Phycisphaerales bacterium]|nr:hypothetical protein [Phycisphaerales bacterium]
MTPRIRIAALALILTTAVAPALACGGYPAAPVPSEPELSQLRAEGQSGLDALMARFAEEIHLARGDSPAADSFRRTERWIALSSALDRVAGQVDSHASGLFWHTDFDRATAEARRTGRPILSLRLLGRLDEELSCANSRFLRTTLYADPRVADTLRSTCVLHWKSVRPVPRVTIDFGDGRVLERTLTGNSIQYVLNADGQVIDAVPGLVDSASFLAILNDAVALHTLAGHMASAGPGLVQLFRRPLDRALEVWGARLAATTDPVSPALGDARLTRPVLATHLGAADGLAPAALAAAPVAMTKRMVELAPIEALVSRAERIRTKTDDAEWRLAGQLHEPYITIADACVRLMRSKCGGVGDFEAKLARYRASLAADTVYNLAALRPTILSWLANADALIDVEALNQRVYAELFLTPDSDPWLGLAAADDFTALPGEGVRFPTTTVKAE